MAFDERSLINTYRRFPVLFASGSGAVLYDDKGKDYIDLLAGIAVTAAGHANPQVAAAISAQAEKLVHVSNYFWNEPMARLAAKLRKLSGDTSKVFFANSGAEANECAIKLARKWAGPGRWKIICAEGSFHGRTLATLAATGQPAKWCGFEPLPAGFVHAEFNNVSAFEKAVDAETAAIMVEPILGERGVVPASVEFLQSVRELATKNKLALIFDEIQTGMGRTGSWWAFQTYGVCPDIFTTAKALANGLPIGACIAEDSFAEAFGPGDHGSTFGGGPVVCSAALATIAYLELHQLPIKAPALEAVFRSELQKIPFITGVRGMGLMLAATLQEPIAPKIAAEALNQGLVVNAVTEDALRMVPPLVITEAQIAEGCARLKAAIEKVTAGA